LEITLTQHESIRHQHLCIEDRCQHLGNQGCTLGDDKPLSCKLYPLSYDHQSDQYYFDAACPLLPEYTRQLQDPQSDASAHLHEMNRQLTQLAAVDSDFLKRNHAIDLDFFELVPVTKPPHLNNL
jgi:Fe-S-cluster containining protein